MSANSPVRGTKGRGRVGYLLAAFVIVVLVAGVVIVPRGHIGSEWLQIPGRVVVVERETGRWTTPIERRLGVEVQS
jgi:hypothetical protein